MKHYNPFDFYENNENTIDEKTIYEETGVSYDNIRNTVLKNINKPKSKRRRKTPLIALVAIIAIIASLTTTAYATGKFSDIFGYLFSGECENGLYRGGNVQISCSDNTINAEVLGISSGNQSEAYVAYKLTKKDNTSFGISADKINDTKVEIDYTKVTVEDKTFFELFPSAHVAMWSSNCTLVDEKTIIAYVCFNSDTSIRGKQLTVELNNLSFTQIHEHTGEYIEEVSTEKVKIIEECKPVNNSRTSDEYYTAILERYNKLNDEYGFVDEDNKKESIKVLNKDGKDYICLATITFDNEKYQKTYDSKKQQLEKKYNLNENQKLELIYNNELGVNEFCVITYNEMDINVTSSLELNYRENSKEYTIDNKITKDIIQRELAEIRSAKLVVSPFSLQYKYSFKDMSYYFYTLSGEYENDERVKILRMNDGTEYYLLAVGESLSVDEKTGEVEIIGNLTISLTNDIDHVKMVAIDMENVKEIQIGDSIIAL